MANVGTLWIKEYAAVGWSDSVGSGGVSGPDAALPCPQEPGLDQSRIILSDTTDKQSTAFAANTRFIALCSNVPFHYQVGTNPKANINHFRMPADVRLYVGVEPGHKLSALGSPVALVTLAEQE